MMPKHRSLCWPQVCILCLLSFSLHIIGVLSTAGNALYSRTGRNLLFETRNRDGDLPSFPIEPDLRFQSSYIFNAHEVLRQGLQQILGFKDTDLANYLSYLIFKRTEPFVDEYGQVIRVYKKVFRFIWEQHNETLVQNYAVGQFNKDKLDLCSVARYLSHQPAVEQRRTIMKRMGDALGYRCHPCTPYTPKQYDVTIVPSTDGINPEGVSPEESLILCKESQIQEQRNLPLLGNSTTSPDNNTQDSIIPTPFILKAHEILRNGLQEFLNLNNSDLGTCLKYLIYNRTEPFIDENGQIIRNFKKVLRFIWEQHNETLVENYKIREFNQDKLQLCSVARYLSHQTEVKERLTIMKRVGEALNYTCHPCTPYTPKQHNETFVPSIYDIIQEGIHSENVSLLCGENKFKENPLSTSTSNPTSTPIDDMKEDSNLQATYIVEAHEVLRKVLKEFLGFKDATLGTYLSYLIYKRTEPFVDEYGRVIRAYKKVFRFIWEQHNETLVEKYTARRFNKDKLDLCSVARYLSHQPTLEQRATIMKRMGDALGYRCHPCTPYTPKQYGETIVPSTDDISPEGVSPEDSLILCKESQTQGQESLVSWSTSRTSQGKTTATVESIEPENPLFDYSPCSHSNGKVVCDKVPLEEVRKVFKRTSSPRLASVQLTLQPYIFTETLIPEDIFGTKRILEIWIQFPFKAVANRSLSLEVDVDAFRSAKSYTKEFTINIIDCVLLDLGFLAGFDKLTNLTFSNINNIQYCFPSLPPLPSLIQLKLEHCRGMNEVYNFPKLTNRLNSFQFSNDNITKFDSNKIINDETVDRIMDWLLISSAYTLEEMGIVGMNQVTRVPDKITSFKALRKLWFYDNNIFMIKSGAFSFSVPVSLLNIKDNGIKEIESGAFQGDFKDAEVYMFNNNLTRFEESVFGPILQQMTSRNGFISAQYDSGNPIDCSDGSICHLAWLWRYKVDSDFSLKCSNGTSFKDLQKSGFNHCPE